MNHVVEQRPSGEPNPEQQWSGPDDPGTELGSAATPHLDPEQVRQFQEFQQFQQFLRFQEAQRAGTELAPHQSRSPAETTGQLLPADQQAQQSTHLQQQRKVPGWLEWLGKKIISWLIFFLLLAITLTWAYNYFLGGDDDNSTESAARQGGGSYHTREILSKEPHWAVRQVYSKIAQEDPQTNEPSIAQACGRFDNATQDQFARNLGYSDCRRAVLALHEEVTHVSDYARSIHSAYYDPNATSLRIDSCDFDVRGGPALGVFTVTQIEMGQWLITGHEPGPKTCPASSGTLSPPAGTR